MENTLESWVETFKLAAKDNPNIQCPILFFPQETENSSGFSYEYAGKEYTPSMYTASAAISAETFEQSNLQDRYMVAAEILKSVVPNPVSAAYTIAFCFAVAEIRVADKIHHFWFPVATTRHLT